MSGQKSVPFYKITPAGFVEKGPHYEHMSCYSIFFTEVVQEKAVEFHKIKGQTIDFGRKK